MLGNWDIARGATAEQPALAGWARRVALLLAGTAFLAASARISVPLPFTPTPITAQTLAVLLIGALFGARLGAATVLAYLVEGAAGLPVFHAGTAGLPILLGPTGGYLIGFVGAAWIAGWLIERNRRGALAVALVAFLLGDAAEMALGAAWLGRFVGAAKAWADGVAPFLPGEIVKIAVAAAVLSSGQALLRARR